MGREQFEVHVGYLYQGWFEFKKLESLDLFLFPVSTRAIQSGIRAVPLISRKG